MVTNKPKFQVVDDKFVWQTAEGEVKLPLAVKTKVFRSLADEKDELVMLFAILDGIGDTDTAATIDELDVFETMEGVGKFFEEFQKKADATMGESRGSSRS